MRLLLALLLAAPLAAQPTADLEALFQDWDAYQEQAGTLGSPDDPSDGSIPEFSDVTEAGYAQRAAEWQGFLDRVEAIPADDLDTEDRISHDLFARTLRDRIAEVEFRAHRIPLTSEGGFHTGFAWLPARMTLTSVAQAERYIQRLREWPAHAEQQLAQLRTGLAEGWTLPREAIAGFDQTAATYIADEPEASVFWQPFATLPPAIPGAEQDRLRLEVRNAIAEDVTPTYERIAAFFRDEYLPNARTTVGASEMPGGRPYYEHLVRHFTTLDVTPEEVHEIGLAEVARIQSEMEAVIEEVEFEGDFAAFLDFLRTDPQFYAQTPDELLMHAAWISKRMDGELPKLIGRLPRRPYGVAPVPAEIAPNYTAGRYVPGGLENGAAGLYWVNTHALESRPLYALEALSFHEAVPGHHLQIALTQELDGLPRFRRDLYLTAYGEGWALYAESLGEEVGFYTDPYSRFGRLTYEMWRACRLVVDTGLHAFGWTRQQAIDYLASRTALSLHEVTTEIDRYITWPGQALGYKMGELTIRRLRTEAESELGEAFDLRAFHDEVLTHGTLPLTTLETVVRDWVAAQQPQD